MKDLELLLPPTKSYDSAKKMKLGHVPKITGLKLALSSIKTRLGLLVRYRRSVFGLCYTLNGLLQAALGT